MPTTTIPDTVNNALLGTTGTVVMQAWHDGMEAAVPVDEYPLAQWSAILQGNICPLCGRLDGQIDKRDGELFRRFGPPVHINCRCNRVYIHKSEVGPDGKPTRASYKAPDSALVRRHGHYANDPEKYRALRVMARPDGRDFIVIRRPNGMPSEIRWRDNLSNEALQETLVKMADGIHNTRRIKGAGEIAQAMRMMDVAAARQLFDHVPRDLPTHVGDWAPTAGVLTEDEFRAVPYLVVNDPDVRFATRVHPTYGVEWVVYVPQIAIDDTRRLTWPAVVYAPERGRVIHWYRIGDPEQFFEVDPSVQRITGDWSDMR